MGAFGRKGGLLVRLTTLDAQVGTFVYSFFPLFLAFIALLFTFSRGGLSGLILAFLS